MAVDAEGNEISETNIDTNKDVTTNIADTVLVEDIKHPNDDLDRRLDELAGKKPNEATKAADTKTVPTKSATVPDGKATQTQTAQPTQQERPNSERGRAPITPRAYPSTYKVDSTGAVVDAATNKVVAPPGMPRRAFEIMLPYINELRTDAEKHARALDAATNANTVAASLKLSPDEYTLGARIMAAYKSDPKKAIQFLLTEAQNNGIDTSDIAAGGGGVSADFIKTTVADLIKENLAPFLPFVQEREQSEQQRQAEASANEGVHSFLERYPDAELHGLHIANIMKHHVERGEDIDMEKAYLILRNHAFSNGLDWNKDLTEQVLAKNGRTTTVAASTSKPAIQQQRELPNMNGREGNGSVVIRPNTPANGLMDTADIVRESMRAAGMQI